MSDSYQVGDGAGVAHDRELSEKLRDLSGRGGTAKLADLTEFAWERVHVFSEGASAGDVERTAGEPVLGGEFYYDAGNLLVFEYNGRVSKAVSVVPDLLVMDGKRTCDAGTVLRPQSATRPATLKLTET
ncbi:hypothetical protein DVA86_33905 [Streptomyces armeniacus]|uniref:Uncharacterized protein n=1 Tax=Streptomyces armeniacus TaxID=83291 RepID=A0A345XYT4_9ACTN|nr:hypothetical protein [Streptomyces armeniacus]AXK36800.1 hypothetical protein DVA86_33905 [Streptomyces armeniacus]